MTIRYAIGKNTTEGMTHMMCIDGTEGEQLPRPACAARTTWATLRGADPPPDLVAGCENPKPCQSELIVLEHGSYSGDPVTKVLLQPLTGGSSGPGRHGHGGLLRLDRQRQHRCCSGTCACSPGPWLQRGGVVKIKA